MAALVRETSGGLGVGACCMSIPHSAGCGQTWVTPMLGAQVQLLLPESSLGRSVGGYRLLGTSKFVPYLSMCLVGLDVMLNSFVFLLSDATVGFFPFYC